jgi:hypothetical protein
MRDELRIILNYIQFKKKLSFFSNNEFHRCVIKSRSDGQTLVAVALDQRLLDEIDRRRGLVNRSAFIRESLVAHYNLPAHFAAAPDRTGKGGRAAKSLIYNTQSQNASILNDAPNPEALPSKGRVSYSNKKAQE